MIDYVADCIQDPEDSIEVWDQASHISGDTQDGIVFTIKNGPVQCSVIISKDDAKLLAKGLLKNLE